MAKAASERSDLVLSNLWVTDTFDWIIRRCARGVIMAQPFYGVDGNLLVEDLPHPREVVEAILDGRFMPTYWAQQMLPIHLYTTYPQLADERRKRAHRKTYRAHLEALRRQRSSPPSAPRG